MYQSRIIIMYQSRTDASLFGRIDDFVFGNKSLHDEPAYEVGATADAEHDEVACGLAFKTHETHVGLCRVVEEDTRTVVDKCRADTAGHAADTDDGCDGRFGEHVGNDGIDVGAPGLVCGAGDTDDDDRPPL